MKCADDINLGVIANSMENWNTIKEDLDDLEHWHNRN